MLTVIIATHNGARTLPMVLASYTHLAPPRGGWKLVIVDNASTDDTREVIRSFLPQLPITCVFEEKRGKNWACLKGLEHLEGDLVVFSDDDALPDANWLTTLRAVADEQPDYDFFGGAIKPLWEVPPQPWILEYVNHPACFAITNSAQPEGPVAPTLVWGPNLAFRRSIFDLGLRFDPAVGPTVGSYPMGSETDLNVRLGEAGFKAWFCPRAVVHHYIRASQMERAWLFGRAVRSGKGVARLELIRETERPPLIFGVPRYLYRQIATRAARCAAATLLRKSAGARFTERWYLNYLLGRALQAREFYRGSKDTTVAPPTPAVRPAVGAPEKPSGSP